MSQLIDPGLFKDAGEGEGGVEPGARPFASLYPDARPTGAGFQDPRRLAAVLCVILAGCAILDTAVGLGLVLAIAVDPGLMQGEFAALIGVFYSLMILAVLARLVVFMMWVYRANKNARAVSPGIETTPGWAVGFFFVPLVSWIRPYLTMSEIWRSAVNPLGWRGEMDPLRLRLWWGFWVAGSVLGLVSRFADDDFGVLGAPLATLAGIAANIFLFSLVRTISRNQWAFRETSVFD